MRTVTCGKVKLLRAALLCGWLVLAAGSPSGRAAPVTVPDTIAQRLQACTACHGKQGRAAPDGYYPRIAGKPAGYLFNQMTNFREGRRHYALMTGLMEPLSDDYLREIAAYFAALEVPYPAPLQATADAGSQARGQTLATRGDDTRNLPACAACHGSALTGVAPAIPGLVGLPRDYLAGQLGAWVGGQRRAQAPDCMAQIVQRLGPGDIAAVTDWLASQPVTAPKPLAALAAPLPLRCGGVPEAAR